MHSFSDIINAWPEPAPVTLATDLGEEPATIRQCRLRDALPPHYWRRAVAAARRRRLRGVTLQKLAEIAERKAAA